MVDFTTFVTWKGLPTYPVTEYGPVPLCKLDNAKLQEMRDKCETAVPGAATLAGYLNDLLACETDAVDILLRLLSCQDATVFGLPEELHLPLGCEELWPGMKYVSHLGHGGFCVVNKVLWNGKYYALKFTLDQNFRKFLATEVACYAQLTKGESSGKTDESSESISIRPIPPNIAHLEGILKGADGKVTALLFRDVGHSVPSLLRMVLANQPDPTVRTRVRLELASRVLAALLPALREAHTRGVLHCDVRPDNIIILCARDPPTIECVGSASILLNDWGVGVLCDSPDTKSRARNDVFGQGSFMADTLLNDGTAQGPQAPRADGAPDAAAAAPRTRKSAGKGRADPAAAGAETGRFSKGEGKRFCHSS